MEKINKICRSILKLTDAEITQCEKDIAEQASFYHPFKKGKQLEMNETGRHNLAVMEQLKKLREVLIAADPNK